MDIDDLRNIIEDLQNEKARLLEQKEENLLAISGCEALIDFYRSLMDICLGMMETYKNSISDCEVLLDNQVKNRISENFTLPYYGHYIDRINRLNNLLDIEKNEYELETKRMQLFRDKKELLESENVEIDFRIIEINEEITRKSYGNYPKIYKLERGKEND